MDVESNGSDVLHDDQHLKPAFWVVEQIYHLRLVVIRQPAMHNSGVYQCHTCKYHAQAGTTLAIANF